MIVIGLHLFLLCTNWYLAMICSSFDVYDRIAILFCGAQKTAAMGLPIIETMFGESGNLGMYIIPLLMYHPFQLIFDSLLVYPLSNWRAKQEEKGNDDAAVDMIETSINTKSAVSQINLNEL